MSPTEAANVLRERMREDVDVRRSIMMIVKRAGLADVFEWAEANPDQVVLLAESLVDVDGQIATFASRLKRGDLS